MIRGQTYCVHLNSDFSTGSDVTFCGCCGMGVAGHGSGGNASHRRVRGWGVDAGASLVNAIHPELLEGGVCGDGTDKGCSESKRPEHHIEGSAFGMLKQGRTSCELTNSCFDFYTDEAHQNSLVKARSVAGGALQP